MSRVVSSLSQKTAADVGKLNAFPDEAFPGFLQILSSYLSSSDDTAFEAQCTEFAESIGANPTALLNFAKSFASVLRLEAKLNANAQAVSDDMRALGISGSNLYHSSKLIFCQVSEMQKLKP